MIRRALVECSTYTMNNIGDKAMLAALSQRLYERFPGIELHIVTCDPQGIREVIPDAVPFQISERVQWSFFRRIFKGYNNLDDFVETAETDYALRQIYGDEARIQFEALRANDSERGWADLKKLIEKIDFAIVMGGGYFSDAFPYHTHGIFETLDTAMLAGKPAFIMGAGFEPVKNIPLRRAASAVLPRLSLIGTREEKVSRSVLDEFGVHAERILFLGDEALMLSHNVALKPLGNDLGINYRLASYANTEGVNNDVLARTIATTVKKLQANLRPLPISLYAPSDPDAIRKLLELVDIPSDGGVNIKTPEQLIRETQNCRVVVTGSYHAAVFAFAQGIPAVMLANTLHYITKMQGLADQFGGTVIQISDPELDEKLAKAIEDEWLNADDRREKRLQTVQKLVEANQHAYDKLAEIVNTPLLDQQSIASSWPDFTNSPKAMLLLSQITEEFAEQSASLAYHAEERLKQIHILNEQLALKSARLQELGSEIIALCKRKIVRLMRKLGRPLL